MSAPREKRHQTGLTKGEDGRYKMWCRICPRRQWRTLPPDQRADMWFDTSHEAVEQAQRHRRSEFHQQVVQRLASNEPTQEEVVLARIFGGLPSDDPCGACGFHHSKKLDCVTAARIRDKEML